MRSAKTRVLAFFTLVILTAVFSASALTANVSQSAAPETAPVQESGFFASNLNNFLSFFGLAEAASAPQDSKASGCDTAPEGLIACYRGDMDASDVKGVHNGEWVGTYGFAAGKVGAGAFSFDGKNRVEVPNAEDLNPVNLTVDGWVNLSSSEGTFGLISKGDAYSLQIRGGSVVFTSRNTEGEIEELVAPNSIGTSKWVHIAATHDGTTVRIYVDGEEAISGKQAGLFGADQSNLTIGSTITKEAYYVGLADEVKVFGRALTAKEVKGLAANRPDAPENITSIVISPNPVAEAAGTTTVTVNRNATNAANGAVVNFVFAPVGGAPAVQGASCAVGVDYVPNSNSVVFGPGDTAPKFFTIQICDDAAAEGNETFTVTATLIGNALEEAAFIASTNDDPQTVTILDDDFATVTSPATVAENNTGGGTDFNYTINRGGTDPAAGSFAFQMGGAAPQAQFAASTGTTAQDYTQTGGTCTAIVYNNAGNTGTGTASVPAGESSCTIRFTTVGDTFVEQNENASLTVLGPFGNAGSTSNTVITNDDNPFISVTVTSNNPPASDGKIFTDEGNPTNVAADVLTFTFTRGLCAAASPGTPGGQGTTTCPGGDLAALPANQVVTYSTTGVATPGTDYPTPSGTVTFVAAGSTTATLVIDPTNDIVVETDESVIITVTNTNGGAYNVDTTPAGNAFATGFINDDDEDVTVTPNPPTNSPVLESSGTPLQFTVTRIDNSTGIAQTGFFGTPPPTIPSGDALTVNFALSGTATGGAACPGNGGLNDYTVTSGDGHTVLYNPATCTGTIQFGARTILFGNDTTAVVNVTPTNDSVPENDETVTFTIAPNTGAATNNYGVGSPNNGTGTPPANASSTGFITNDDVRVTVRVTPLSVPEGSTATPNAATLVYTFTRIGESAVPTCVNFNASGSASANSDYTTSFGTAAVAPCTNTFTPGVGTSTGTISIAAGQGAGVGADPSFPGVQTNNNTFIVNPTDDDTVEPNEEVQVQVDNGPGYVPGTPAQASGLILNDDSQRVSVTVSGDVAEGNTTPVSGPGQLTYTFTRTQSDGNALSVTYSVGGTVSANDFQNPPFLGNNVVTFAAGQTVATVVVTAVRDNDVEANETVIVTVLDGTGFTAFAPASATGTFLNDDNDIACTGPTGGPGGNPTVVTEGGTLTYSCTRSTNGAAGALPLSIAFTVTGSARFQNSPGASDPNDFTIGGNTSGVAANGSGATGQLNFAAGNSTATIVVTATQDTVVEPDETVIVDFAANGQDTVNFIAQPGSDPAQGNAPQGFDLTGTTLTGTIASDDNTVSVGVSITNPDAAGDTVTESGGRGLRYTFSRATNGTAANLPLSINFSVTGTACRVLPCAPGGNVPPTDSLAVDYAITFPAGTTGTYDPATGTGTIVIPGTVNTASFIATPIDDSTPELPSPETVIVTITAQNPVVAGSTYVTPTGAGASATGNITDDDTTYTITDSSTTEGDGPAPTQATFTVTRSGNTSLPGQVTISTIPGSGTATAQQPNVICGPGDDYITDGTTLTFAPGVTTQTFIVNICGDLAFELTETFDAQLTNPVNGTITGDGMATMTIFDNDNKPFLTIGNVTVNEAAGTVTLTVNQSVATGVNTTFTFSTGAIGDTATADVDYDATTGNGTIVAGQTSTTITIAIIDDNLDEPNETFTVTITGATNASISPAPADPIAIVTITDNEDATNISVSDVAQIEGNANPDPNITSTSSFNFNITRVGDAQADQTVCFETRDGDLASANANPNQATGGDAPGPGIDYRRIVANPINCVTFTQGGPSVISVPVIVYGDNNFEFDESFTLVLLTASNAAVITDPFGLGTILNDDLASVFNVASGLTAPNSIIETDLPTPTQNYPFVITRTQSDVQSTIQYTTSNGNTTTSATGGAACVANNGVDYITTSGTLTFLVGETTKTVNVPICGDLFDENNETFTFTISNATLATIGTSSATGTIVDNDGAPIISVSDVAVCEPDTGGVAQAVFTITRSGPSNLTSTVNVSTVDGSATTADNDYVAIVNQLVTFAPGETTKTVSVTVNGDEIFETDETFTLQVIAGSSDVVIAQASGADPVGLGIIRNDFCNGANPEDPAPTFAVDNVTRNEGNPDQGPTTEFRFRITRTGLTQLPSNIGFSTANGTTNPATGGASCGGSVDYISQSGSVNFTSGGLNFRDVVVLVCTDTLTELNETFFLNLISATNGTIPADGQQGLGTISNDDGLNFTVDNIEGNEGNAGTTNFVFRINKNGTTALSSNVSFTIVDGTATGGAACGPGVDFIRPSTPGSPVTFTSGETFREITVQVCGDLVPEANETFTLRLDSATVGTVANNPGTGTGTILNDDGPVPSPTPTPVPTATPTPAPTPTPVPTPTPGIEGDVVDGGGGSAGDGQVLANDVNVTRQMALGNTPVPAAGSQFQRADTGPRDIPNGICGDGFINASDVTVTRQYALGNFPPTPACGPTVPVIVRPVELSRTFGPENVGRIIRVVSQSVPVGTTQVTVSIALDSQGNESSAQYTVNFNPAVFSNPVVALGAGVPAGSVVNTNVNQVAQGRLGILVDSVNTYAQGTRQMVTITFNVAPGTPAGTYPISFSATPTAQAVSSATGTLLATTYETGNVVIGPTAAGVRISGRVTTPGGQGLRNATVVITDSEGVQRTAVTSSFGIYTFEDIEVGESYVMGVSARRYRFASRILNVSDNLSDVNFVGQE